MRFFKLLPLALLLFCPTVYAATTLTDFYFDAGSQIAIDTSFTRPATIDSGLYTVTGKATTNIPISPPNPIQGIYQVKLWVTVGSEAAPSDTPRASTFVGFGIPDPNDPIVTELSTTFRLPTPNNSNPSPSLQAGLTAADLIGQSIYVKICIEPSGRDSICLVDSIAIHPEQPTFFESPSLTQINRATLYWNAIPVANSRPLAHGHRISFLNQNDSSDQGSVYVPRVNDSQLVSYNGVLRNRLILQTNPTRPTNVFTPKPGVAYQATLQACGQSNAVCGESRVIQNVTAFSSEFSASEGTDTDAVNVSWVTHSPATPSYNLRRCLASNSSACVDLAVGSNATTYRDTTAVPNVRYRYTVFAGSIATGITNAGFRAQETPNPIAFVNASDGTQPNRIDVNWSEFSPAASNFINSGYLVEATNQATMGDPLVREIAYQANQSSTAYSTGSNADLPAGVLFKFKVLTCANFDSASPNCANVQITDTGYALARFSSGSPSAGVAQIGWTSFSQDTLRYRLERCLISSDPQCEFIEAQSATTYQDEGLSIGERYRYSVYACRTPQNSQCEKTGDTEPVQIVDKVEPDQFEDDDSPLALNQANQTIRGSVTQQRSFHEGEDQDWLRLIIESGQREFDIRTESAFDLLTFDSQLTLFDDRGRIVACALNNATEFTGDARLRIGNLPAGEYFLRTEQQPTGFDLEPIDRYILKVTISAGSTGDTIEFGDCSDFEGFPGGVSNPVITPVLQLLLLDEQN